MTTTGQGKVQVRRPRTADWGRVMEILQTANFHRIGGPEMRRFDPENCFVAEIDNSVVGVAGYQILTPEVAKTTLLVVDPDSRYSGIGTALQKHRLAYLRKLGIRTMYTNCDDPNVIAWNCRSFGYRPTGRMLPKLEPYGLPDKDAWTNLRLEIDPTSTALDPHLPASCNSQACVHELDTLAEDAELTDAIMRVVDHMRRDDRRLTASIHSTTEAESAVAESALLPLLEEKAWVSDIVEDRALSNCIAYNFANVEDAVMDPVLAGVREHLDSIVQNRARNLFPGCPKLEAENTGHFWFPAGSYMGWHHNLRTPGWRLYFTVTDEPGKSFFRYRDPRSGQIDTSWDNAISIRLFQITPTAPLWHAVYSRTNRISLGYKLILD